MNAPFAMLAGLDSISEQQQLQALQGGMTNPMANSMLQALSQMCKFPRRAPYDACSLILAVPVMLVLATLQCWPSAKTLFSCSLEQLLATQSVTCGALIAIHQLLLQHWAGETRLADH